MIVPSQRRPNAYHGGIIQIHVTRACDEACFGCTQGSQFGGKLGFMNPVEFEHAVESLKDYWGVLGVFGGNPTTSPFFPEYCEILRKLRPKNRCGLWCNNLRGYGAIARETFDPSISNLNVHLNKEAYEEFKRDWPESMPFGQNTDSRHATPFVSMSDMEDVTPEQRAVMIENCDINRNWSAMICLFRGQLRGYFCEVAAAQAMLQEFVRDADGNYLIPDSGIPINTDKGVDTEWWKYGQVAFQQQIDFHCHRCGIPMRGRGELAVTGIVELYSLTYKDVVRPKRKRVTKLITKMSELTSEGKSVTNYLGK